jgi:hypothetical protein
LTREGNIQAKFIIFFEIELENSRGMFKSFLLQQITRLEPQFSDDGFEKEKSKVTY